MLVITRRVEEGVVIEDLIKIKVLGIRGGQVQLGIEAPRSVKILRQEIVERIEDPTKC